MYDVIIVDSGASGVAVKVDKECFKNDLDSELLNYIGLDIETSVINKIKPEAIVE